jgi:hypothetical protein
MTSYFTVATTTLTADQERELAQRWKLLPWWHWIPNFWLLKDPTGLATAASLRDTLVQVAPTARAMVVEMDPKTWAGMFPETGDVRDWLRNNWPPEKR